MTSHDERARVYTEIADAYERRGQGQLRDRFLVLAADAAQTSGLLEQAEHLRRRLLAASPHHLLKPFASFAQALDSPDLLSYIRDLRRNYPPRTAEELLQSLQDEDGSQDRAGGGTSPDFRFDTAAPPERTLEPSIYKLREKEKDTINEASLLPPTLPPGTRFDRPVPSLAAKPLAKTPTKRSTSSPTSPAGPVKPASRPITPLPFAPTTTVESAEAHSGEEEFPPGAWLAALLFGLLSTAAALLAGYTLFRPLLTHG